MTLLHDRQGRKRAATRALTQLADPAFYSDAGEVLRLNAAFQAAEVEALFARWAELEDRAG